MITKERKAQIARENGAKSKGPKTTEGKEHSRRNAITHGERATMLKLIVPPHSACLANENRQAYYTLYDHLVAKYRPTDETELGIVREIVDYQWKLTRNKQMETAIYNRELMRQAARTPGSVPELRDLEIAIAAREALTGNQTVAELRREAQTCIRTLAQLQRRLTHIQKNWPAAEPLPPTPEENEIVPESHDKRTDPESPKYDVTGPVTPNVIQLYRDIFHKESLELHGHEPIPHPEAA